jgi:peptidoglycan/xylan/chitin deacetylase (PgdA/CDA1 family)
MRCLRFKIASGEHDNVSTMDSHIKKIKIYFTITTLVIVGIIGLGVRNLQGGISGLGKDVASYYVYSRVAFAYAFSQKTNILAEVSSAFPYMGSVSVPQNATDVPVLLYHGIVSKPDRFSMTTDTFADQMFALKNAGYHTVTVEQFDEFMQGKITLPDKSFLLTFDDGRKDSYVGADPVLKATGFHAIMFVPSGDTLDLKNSTYYLDESDMKDMLATGRWEFGSHAIQADTQGGEIQIDAQGDLGNLLSNKMWLADKGRIETDAEYEARIVHELADSKTQLENTLGIHISSFAYPFSDYGQQGINDPTATTTINNILKKNYDVAFEQVNLDNGIPTDVISNYPGEDPYHLHRIETPTDWTGAHLVSVLQSGMAKTLPYSDSFSSDSGWRSTWGTVSVLNNTLQVDSLTTTTGAFAFLDGTRGLTDYLYTAQVNNANASTTVTLVSRYQDEDNYLSCSFSSDQVEIQERVGGVIKVLAQDKDSIILPQSSVSLGIFVGGSIVKCYEGSRAVTYVLNYDNALDSGGVGVKIWNENLGVANISLSNITLTSEDSARDFLVTLPKYTLATSTPTPVVSLPPVVVINPTVSTSSPATSTPPSQPIPVSTPAFNVSLFDTDGNAVPYALNFGNYAQEWKNMFGSLSQSDGSLLVGSNASTTSSLAVFLGGMQWEDYRLDTVVDWGKGSGFSLVGRYIDSKNYVTCSYSYYGEYVSLYSTENGVTQTIARSPRLSVPDYQPWVGTKLGMTVQGDEAECLINGQWAIRGQTGLTQPGTIGFKSYYQTANGALMSVRSATVTAIESK